MHLVNVAGDQSATNGIKKNANIICLKQYRETLTRTRLTTEFAGWIALSEGRLSKFSEESTS
jgi:hypothetical protein